MKISYLWLKEFVDFDLSPEELCTLLRNLGFDTGSVETFGGEIKNVVTARVLSRDKHPNADKLSLCKVFDGKDHFDVVCGAPNVAAGQVVPLARVGALLPGGMKIDKAVIRGQASFGMLCSARELGLAEDAVGIMVLPEGTPLGENIGDTLFMHEAVLDVEVMPNRPDVLSHWGVAREIAAALKKKLRLPDMKIPKVKKSSGLVQIESPILCTRYVGRVVNNVQVRPSPLWMRLRLERCGIRSINNLVDVTNYVLLELGHPQHVFDRDLLREGRVVVRQARPNESLLCLDEQTRALGRDLLIADAENPVAIAGIMGGELSAVNEKTGHLLLESAHFESSNIRRSRKCLNMSTESSYRFERGTDWTMVDLASRRTTHLVLSLAGGTLTQEQDVYLQKPKISRVHADANRVNGLLGTSLPHADIRSCLMRLGFVCRGKGARLTLTPPIHRQDVKELADVAEEVVRLAGYDKVPQQRRNSTQEPDRTSRESHLVLKAKDFFVGQGFYEARNYGLVSRKQVDDLYADKLEACVALENPVSTACEFLCPGLLAGLLQNLQANLRHGTEDVRLFETARVFLKNKLSAGEGHTPPKANNDISDIKEWLSLAWVAAGRQQAEHWQHKTRLLDVWDAKSWVSGLLREWRFHQVKAKSSDLPVFLHPGEAQSIFVRDKPLGFFGRIHPRQAELWDVPKDVFVGEVNLSMAASLRSADIQFQGLPKHPAVIRDFSMIFPEKISWASISAFLMQQSEWVEDVQLFDLFVDPSIPSGHRSLSFRLFFRTPERTLTDAEVNGVQEKNITRLKNEFSAISRVGKQ